MSAFFLLLTRLLVGTLALFLGGLCVTEPDVGQTSLHGLGLPDLSENLVTDLGYGLIVTGAFIAIGLLSRFTLPLLMIFWGCLFLVTLIHLREVQFHMEQGVCLLMLSSVLLLMARRRQDRFSFDALVCGQQVQPKGDPDVPPADKLGLSDDPHDVFELVEIDMRSDMKADKRISEAPLSDVMLIDDQKGDMPSPETVEEIEAPEAPVKRKKKYPAVHSYH